MVARGCCWAKPSRLDICILCHHGHHASAHHRVSSIAIDDCIIHRDYNNYFLVCDDLISSSASVFSEGIPAVAQNREAGSDPTSSQPSAKSEYSISLQHS